MPKYKINEGVGMGLEHEVEAADYEQVGDLIVFYDQNGNKVHAMRADTLASIKTL